MSRERWRLFEPIEDHFPKAKSTADFYAAATACLGRKIAAFYTFADECYMYRRFGDWRSLVREIAHATPPSLRFTIATHRAASAKGVRKEAGEVFASCLPDAYDYYARDVWDEYANHDQLPNGRIVLPHFPAMANMMMGKATAFSKPVQARLFAFMRVCRLGGLVRDLRRALASILLNLEVDYALAFHAVCAYDETRLLRTCAWINDNELRVAKRARHDTINLFSIDERARNAALFMVRQGPFGWISRGLTAHALYLKLAHFTFWNRYRRTLAPPHDFLAKLVPHLNYFGMHEVISIFSGSMALFRTNLYECNKQNTFNALVIWHPDTKRNEVVRQFMASKEFCTTQAYDFILRWETPQERAEKLAVLEQNFKLLNQDEKRGLFCVLFWIRNGASIASKHEEIHRHEFRTGEKTKK